MIFLIIYSNQVLSFEYSYSFSLSKPDETAMILPSAASCLAWSSDGQVLAASWKNGGMAVWSLQGRLLTSTCFDDTHSPGSSSDNIMYDAFFYGVENIFWGDGDFDLFVLPSAQYHGELTQNLYALQFAKSGVGIHSHYSNSKNMFLVCDDHLLVYEGNFSDVDILNLDPLQWRIIQMPSSYLAMQWPIECASIDNSSNLVAIAGRHGFAHYSLQTGKWKIFGSERQEQTVWTSHLVWIRSYIVVAYRLTGSEEYNIGVFSKNDNLDLNNCSFSLSYAHPIITMNSQDTNLLVYYADNSLQYYELKIHSGNIYVLNIS